MTGRLGPTIIATLIALCSADLASAQTTPAFTPGDFLSPRIIAAIIDGTAPADLTITGLAKRLPSSPESILAWPSSGGVLFEDHCVNASTIRPI